MKKIHLLLIAAASLTIFASCGEKMPDKPTKGFELYDALEYAEGKNPKPINVSDTVVYTGQGITFVSTQNNADTYVVWPGDPGFAYADREGNFDETDTTNQVSTKSQGIALAERYGEYSSKVPYVYDTVGDFTVTFVARNIYKNKYGDFDYVETLDSTYITVIDTLAEVIPPSGMESKYKFFVHKGDFANMKPEYKEAEKEVIFKFPYDADLSKIILLIELNTSLVKLPGAENPVMDKGTEKHTWYRVDLTPPNEYKLTVSALSPGHENEWTIKAEFEPAPVPAP